MANWIKQDDAYFADTFDRSATECSYVVKGVDIGDGVVAVNNCYCDTGLTYAAKAGTCAESVTINSDGILIGNSITSLSDKLRELQEQIDALKRRSTITSELRSALKTLHYKREVE